MKRTVLMILGSCVLAMAGAGLGWWLQEAPPAAQPQKVAEVPPRLAAPAVAAPAVSRAATAPPRSLPASLLGTEVNCPVETGADGHLRITKGLRLCFDYFLAAIGEERVEVLAARIRAELRSRLQEPARDEAEQILGAYLAYMSGMAEFEQSEGVQEAGALDMGALRQRMERVRTLRMQYLSAEVIAAFYGDEDAYDRYTLARLELMRNKELSPQARAQQLAELERQLPDDIQDSRKAMNQYLNLKTLTDDWKQRGGSAEELHQIRQGLLGAEATARLEVLDQENASWDRRMGDWYAQRDELLKTPGLSEEDRERQLDDLRRSSFGNEAERRRVEALERIHDQALLSKQP